MNDFKNDDIGKSSENQSPSVLSRSNRSNTVFKTRNTKIPLIACSVILVLIIAVSVVVLLLPNMQKATPPETAIQSPIPTELTQSGTQGTNDNDLNLHRVWDGLYKSDFNYYIMIYVEDNGYISFNVIYKDDITEFIPIQWKNIISVKDENTIEYSDNITLHIAKNDNDIIITASSSDADSPWNNINGTYTKYRNVSSGDVSEFTEP